MMVAMLGEVAAPTVAIYLELLALRTRTLALSAAAKSTLNQHEHQIFEVLVSMTRASAKKRDKLAHWLWTYSDDISDALLLIDPRDQIPQVAPAVVKLANNRPVRESEFIVAPSRIYVYRPGDFAEIEREFRELENCLVVFNQMVLESSVGEQFRLLTELSRRPPVAQRLFRLRKDQNSRAPPEQSPDAGDPD